MMEHLSAADDGGLEESMRLVDEADIYLGILGHRYGHIPKRKTKSITHLEYERATRRRIPRLIFIMHENHPVRARDVEKGAAAEKLEKFKRRLMGDHTVNFFESPEHLRSLVASALATCKPELATGSPHPLEPGGDEDVMLTARLSANHDVQTLLRVGCPCLVLELRGRSKRPAKIVGASLHLRGPHILAAVQRAFSTDFGYAGGKIDLVDEPDLFVHFLPAAPPNAPHGFVIEQDDMRKFFLPTTGGFLLYFSEAPPEDVYLIVKYLDGHRETLLRGVEVQRRLPPLIRMALDRTFQLHPRIALTMGLHARSRESPDTPLMPGFLNDQTFSLPPHPRRDETIDEESDRIRLRAKILRAGAEWDRSCEDWLIGIAREHEDREVRRDAIVALRRLATPKVREFFFHLLATDFNENTRELIIRSFALVGIAEDMPLMGRMAREETSRFCREAAMVALQYLRDRFVKPSEDTTGPEAPSGEGLAGRE
jgi:hypothetical protein